MSKIKKLGLVIFLVICGLCLVDTKYVSGKTYLTPGKVNEISKFSYRTGRGKLNGQITYHGTPKASIYLFMDTTWFTKYHKEYEDQCDRLKSAHAHFPLGAVGNRIGVGLGTVVGEEPVKLEKRNQYTWNFTWSISHRIRTYGWYVVMADCASDYPTERKKKKKRNRFYHKAEYEFTFLNDGNDHLSADEHWLTEIYVVMTLILSGLYKYFSGLTKKTFGSGPSHLIIGYIKIAYVLQIVSYVFEIIHQVAYRYNGYGVWLFDFFSEMLEGFSQIGISFVLICIGNGWTLVKKNVGRKFDYSVSEVLNNPSLMDIDNPVLFILILLLFVCMVLQLVNKLYDDSFMKFHDHETWAGTILVLLRVIFGVLFWFSLRNTMDLNSQRGAGPGLIQLLRKIGVFGTLWFLSLPAVVFIASFFAHYLRHFVVSSGVMVLQGIAITFLSYEIMSDRSAFARFSEIQQAGMLPGFSRGSTYGTGKFI